MPEIEPVSTSKSVYASSNTVRVGGAGASSSRAVDAFDIEPEMLASRTPGYASYRPQYDDSDLEAGRPAPRKPSPEPVPRRQSQGCWSASKKVAVAGLAVGTVLIGTGLGVYYGYSAPTVRKCAETWCNEPGNAASLTVQQCVGKYKYVFGSGPVSAPNWCGGQNAAGFAPIMLWVWGGAISTITLAAMSGMCANFGPPE